LLKELGDNMTPEQSALAVLVESADWETALGRMADLNLHGEVLVQELVDEHLVAIEKLVDVPPAGESVPEEVKVEAPTEPVAPASEAAPPEAPAAEAPAPEPSEKSS
jgi:hypothetical protein